MISLNNPLIISVYNANQSLMEIVMTRDEFLNKKLACILIFEDIIYKIDKLKSLAIS